MGGGGSEGVLLRHLLERGVTVYNSITLDTEKSEQYGFTVNNIQYGETLRTCQEVLYCNMTAPVLTSSLGLNSREAEL